MRIPKGPLKGTIILLVFAAALTLGLLAIQGRLIPRKPALNKVAFVSDRDGHSDLWLMGVDGSDLQQLTNNSMSEASPSWSGDATRLVFTSVRSGLMQVFSMEAIGGHPQQLTVGTGVKLQPVFSPDAGMIAYIAQGRVYVMNSDGSDIEPVLPSLEAGAPSDADYSTQPYIQADWSADGQSLAAVRRIEGIEIPQLLQDLHGEAKGVTDLQGQPLTGHKVSVKWSPRGRVLAVSTTAGKEGALVAVDYGEESVTIVVSDMLPGRAAWSPSGEQLAFEVLDYKEGHGYSQKALAVADAVSLDHRIIVTGEITNPSWSSDGERIIFTKTEKGVRGIWSVKPDGTDAKNLTAGKGDNYDAVASPAKAESK